MAFCESHAPALDGAGAWGMAFDGRRYILTRRWEPAVQTLDGNCRPVETIRTARPYTAICFDPGRGCFWAAAARCRGLLFRLDADVREVGTLVMGESGRPPGPVTSLSLREKSGRLLATAGDRLWDIDPVSGRTDLLREEGGGTLILAAAALPFGLLLSTLRGGAVYLTLADRAGRTLAEERVPSRLLVDAILPCPRGPGEWDLLLLAEHSRWNTGLLYTPFCSKEMDRENACTGLLESAALSGAAVAHILNAQAELLGAVLRCALVPDDLLRADRALAAVLAAITRLEQAELAKLRTAFK